MDEKTKKWYGRYRSRELVHFWVDYFLAYVEHKSLFKPKILKLWLSRNSNFFVYDENTIIEIWDKNVYTKHEFYFIFKDRKTNINIGFLMFPKHKKIWAISYNNTYEITWQWLILNNVQYYFDLLNRCWLKIDKFKRVDICMDIAEEIQYINDKILVDFFPWKTVNPKIRKGKVETIYIGERDKRKNTYHLIRIYDKKRDTHVKKKWFLYDYEKYKDVTRFEIELRRDKAKFMTKEKLTDVNYIFSICVKNFYKMNHQYFKFLHLEDFKKCKMREDSLNLQRKKDIAKKLERFIEYGNDFFDDKDKKKAINTFVNLAKRLHKNWFSLQKIKDLIDLNIEEEKKDEKKEEN